jgi:threonine synthase
MPARALVCSGCGGRYPLDHYYKCTDCGSVLEVEYDSTLPREATGSGEALLAALSAVRLPVDAAHCVSLGEGNTPLVAATRLSEEIGLRGLYLKCESTNPTGSFKDRPVSVGVTKAVELGIDTVVVASSGNAAASVSAYAARAGLRAIVLVPKAALPGKIAQCRSYGARVIRVEGGIDKCFALAKVLSETEGFCNLSTTFVNPYTVEGNKTIGYEIYLELRRQVPDYVFVPVGAGPMLVGMARGFMDLKEAELIPRLPRFVAVQAAGCAPIAQADRAGERTVDECRDPHSIADGVCDGLIGYPEDGTHTLSYIRRSEGRTVTVTDEEIRATQSRLAEKEGIFAEATGAVALAGVIAALGDGYLSGAQRTVAIVSGHGLKETPKLDDEDIPIIEARPEAVVELLSQGRKDQS